MADHIAKNRCSRTSWEHAPFSLAAAEFVLRRFQGFSIIIARMKAFERTRVTGRRGFVAQLVGHGWIGLGSFDDLGKFRNLQIQGEKR